MLSNKSCFSTFGKGSSCVSTWACYGTAQLQTILGPEFSARLAKELRYQWKVKLYLYRLGRIGTEKTVKQREWIWLTVEKQLKIVMWLWTVKFYHCLTIKSVETPWFWKRFWLMLAYSCSYIHPDHMQFTFILFSQSVFLCVVKFHISSFSSVLGWLAPLPLFSFPWRSAEQPVGVSHYLLFCADENYVKGSLAAWCEWQQN